MRSQRIFGRWAVALTLFAAATMTGPRAVAQEKVLHSFGSGTDGNEPTAGVVFDSSGNLYGTTEDGGAYGDGTVFELLPRVGGGWTERVVHNFGSGQDGGGAIGRLLYASGNLYGTTANGGSHGYGVVFELMPKAVGGWEEKILHEFGSNGTDGCAPLAGLILDGSGNLYGTTYSCGAFGYGTVFELTPDTGGGWVERILHDFADNGSDGYSPEASLIFDSYGNLYGTTLLGGVYDDGIVFELAKTGGEWEETVLCSFDYADGANLQGSLLFDSAGNLYGTTSSGGEGYGTVFELTPARGGGWAESVVHLFQNGKDGDDPISGLILDNAGNLYGTTVGGGTYGSGTVFELSPTAGTWTESILHNFGSSGDGVNPGFGVLVFDGAGNLYGTTFGGGIYGDGTVFEIAR